MSKIPLEANVVMADVATPTGHVYTKEALEKAVALFNTRIQKQGPLHGELAMPRLQRVRDHLGGLVSPSDAFTINLNHVSHSFSNARMDEDGMVKVSVVLLDTPDGKLVQEYMDRLANGTQPTFGIRAGVPPGGKDDNGNITDFIPISVDIVNVK